MIYVHVHAYILYISMHRCLYMSTVYTYTVHMCCNYRDNTHSKMHVICSHCSPFSLAFLCFACQPGIFHPSIDPQTGAVAVPGGWPQNRMFFYFVVVVVVVVVVLVPGTWYLVHSKASPCSCWKSMATVGNLLSRYAKMDSCFLLFPHCI